VKITCRAVGHLARYFPEGRPSLTCEIMSPCTVGRLIEQIGVPRQEVWLISVNNGQVQEDHPLSEGDQVTLLAPVEGG